MNTASTRDADSQEIAALGAEMAAGWAAGDADRFAEPFTADADYIVFNGTHLHGRQAIADAHRHLFATVLKGTHLEHGDAGQPQPHFLTPDVALVMTHAGTPATAQGALHAGAQSVQTLLAVRQAGGQWKFALFQNTRGAAS